MCGPSRRTWAAVALGVFAIVSTVVLGVSLRLEDPVSDPVIPAEDPYTHMTLIREHLADGELSPLYEGGSVYPPGLHAFLGAVHVFTGADLYELVRFAPVAFGAIGILGMALLLWRHLGPLASFVGALSYAVAPELVFRTTMLAPTAFDLGLLPFFLFLLLEVGRGRLGWVGVAAPVTLFLVVLHPWVFWILALSGVLLFVLLVSLPATRAPPWTSRGVTAVIALVGSGLAGAIALGATDVLGLPAGGPGVALAPVVLLGALAPALFDAVRPGRLGRWFEGRHGAMNNWPVRFGIVAALALAVAVVTQRAMATGLPEHVHLPAMIGWPILLLAAAGLLVLPFVRSPIAYLGAAIAISTYPFVMLDVFGSPFWPHRTVAFMAIGLVVLVGVATWATDHALHRLGRLIEAWSKRRAHPGRSPLGALTTWASRWPRPVMQGFSAAIPVLLVATTLGGGVLMSASAQYDGWYRLFTECEQEALEEVATLAEMDPGAVVVTGSWQAKLVVGALATDQGRIWYSPGFFTDKEEQSALPAWLTSEERPLYVVVDAHARTEVDESDLLFLRAPPWQQVVGGCAPGADGAQRLVAYHADPSSVVIPWLT